MEREYDQLQGEMSKISKLLRIVAVFLTLKEFSLALSCSDTGISSAIKLNITCDSFLTLFVDGNLVGEGDANAKNKGFFQYEIAPGSHVVALKCKGNPQPWHGGILGSFENGLVTDTLWKCVTSASWGWNMRTYEDDNWPMATSVGPNDDNTFPWGKLSSIDNSASWIWTKDNVKDTEVYCRRHLVSPCSQDKSAFYNSWVTSKDIAVEGFLLLKTKVTSKIQCGLKCSQHKTCLSFSIQYTRSPGKRICELNTVSAKSHPQRIVKRIGFQYYERVQIFF